MKKLLSLSLVLAVAVIHNVCADTVIIVDDNNVVKQQIYTPSATSTAVTQQQVVVSQPSVVVTQPQVVVPQPQEVVVVRPAAYPQPDYYYTPVATAAVAGFTGALLGNILFAPHHGHHHPHGGPGPRW